MRIVYPYNEILPNRKAHDVFLFSECAGLSSLGFDVHLLCGSGTLKSEDLFAHYEMSFSDHLTIHSLPLIRKNNFLNLSWNFPFFYKSQKMLQKLAPDWVFLSVRKQGKFHLSKKIEGVKYLYEVHELSFYPNQQVIDESAVRFERDMLNSADLVTVTTSALKSILQSPPYSLNVPVEVVPLGVRVRALEPLSHSLPLILTYVGQLYRGQGMEFLLQALSQVEDVHLQIVGGKPEEIQSLKRLALELNIEKRVAFLGFIPPSSLQGIKTHALVAPFQNSGRMPFVAHTKLFEYARFRRPFIAPELQIVEEHFSDKKGVLLFEPDKVEALADAIESLKRKEIFDVLEKEIKKYEDAFSWEKRLLHYRKLLTQFG